MLPKWPALLLFSALLTATSCNGQPAARKARGAAHARQTGRNTGEAVSGIDKNIYCIFQDKQHTYWFGSTGGGVYRYDGRAITHFTTSHGLCNDTVRGIQEDKHGHIFVNTLNGVSKFDGQRWTTLPVAASTEWKSAPGDLWFTCSQNENGPYRYDGQRLYHLPFPKHYLADEFYRRLPNPPYNPYQVYQIYKDRGGNIWFGTSTFGACRYDGKSLSWLYERHLSHIGEAGSFGIRSIIEDADGKFWFCNTRYRFTILPDSPAGRGNGMVRYKREKGMEGMASEFGEIVYYMSIAEDDAKDLWMVTYAGGVWRYHPASGKATHYPVREGASDIKLHSVYKDRRGDLWLATQEAGAYKFNGRTFEPTVF